MGRLTYHILSAVISDIEDLGIEAKPVEISVYLLADVGLSSRRHSV